MSALPAPSTMTRRDREIVALYRCAFTNYRTRALWNLRQFEVPTVEQALLVARHLRVEGDMQARRLAEQIEEATGHTRERSIA